MKEEQFLRQVHKTEADAKSDTKKIQEKFESMMHARQREHDRRSEELDEKLNRSHDEVDELRRKFERVDRINWD